MAYYKRAFLAVLVVAVIQGGSQACQSSTKPARQQPTLDFLPKSKDISGETALIWLQRINKTNYLDWNNKLMETLEAYYHLRRQPQVKDCTYSDGPLDKEVCDISIRDWGTCNRESYFNYYRNSPCIFLKLCQIYGWTPDVYDDPEDLPADMPKSLKEHIGNISDSKRRNNIWISCQGETPADKENLGPVEYYPSIRGLPGYYFPYKQNADYLSPLLAIRLLQPATGIPISIECRAWAKNIKYDKKDGLGSVIFDVLID